jgi:hypothetical protein
MFSHLRNLVFFEANEVAEIFIGDILPNVDVSLPKKMTDRTSIQLVISSLAAGFSVA